MSLERQTAFGWLVAADVFLGGAGAGVFLISFIMDLLNKYEPLAKIGGVSGPVLVLIGALILFADLGAKTRSYRLVFSPSSWITRGTWIMTVFILFGLAYSLPAFGLFAWIPWGKATLLGGAIGVVAAIFSVLTMLYTGFFFSVVKRIPFWNTAALPLLFFFASLCTGMAILLLVAPLFVATLGEQLVATLHTLMIAEIVLLLMQLLVLGVYLEVARNGGTSAVESLRLLKSPLFIGGVVLLGLVTSLGLLLYAALAISDALILSTMAVIGGILLLAGGFLLRYIVIRAGVYLPLYST